MLWKWEKYFWKDLITFLCNNFVAVCLRLKVVWVWPPPTGRTCWPSSHTSPTGAPYISASALCSTNTETRGHWLLSLLNTFISFCPHISSVCVTLFHLIFRLDPTSALDFLWACSHIPRIWQGRDQKTPQVWSQLNITSLYFNAFTKQHLFSFLARLYFLI